MKYQSQKVAFAYFSVAMALFAVQVTVGLLAGYIYVLPNTLSELLPFNIVRMIHTNALIVWLLLGFFGAAYYLVPEEAEREIESPKLAYIQFAILVLGTLGVVVTYIFDLFHGNFLLGKDGREFLEQPLWVKLGIVVAALIFLYNVSMTVLQGRKTAITNVLLLGLWGIAIFFLFALYNPSNLVVDKMYLVVRRPPLGRRRLGAGDGRRSRLPDAQDDGRRPRGHRQVALRHRRLGALQRAAGHRPPLLLDRHAGLLAVDRFDLLEPRSRAVLRHGAVHLLHGLEAPAGSPEQCGAAVEPRLRRCSPSSAPACGASCTRCTA